MAKGLNIQIGADTTKLANALKQSNNMITSSTKELTKFDKLLKSIETWNPKTLDAKYGALTDKLEGLNNKLNLLKDTEEQYKKNGAINYKSKEFRDLQFQIEQTTQELNNVNNEFKKITNFNIEKQNLALKFLNNNIKQTRDEIDRIDQSIKNSSGAKLVELLKDKQILLNNAINNTQKKYDELSKKIEMLKKSGDNLNLSQEIIRTRREMVNCEKAIEDLQKELKTASEIRFERIIRDVENLDKEIKQNIKSSKELETAIKNSSKTEKIEILKDKYKSLETNINLTKEKIKILNVERDLIAKFDHEGKLTEKYKKLTTEISKSKSELNKFQKELSKTNNFSKSIEDLQGKFSNASNKFNNLAGKTALVSASSTAGLTLVGKQFGDFERALIGVEKTTNATDEEMKNFEKTIMEMAKVVPTTQTEIANIMMTAGQLGIKKEDIAKFSKVIIDLSNSTNILGEEGATQMAQYANVTKMSAKDFDRFGSAIVALGNNSATNEQNILNMAQRIGAAGSMAGYSNAEILGFSAALSSLGIEAEAGGTAFSKFFNKLDSASKEGGKSLNAFAKIAGMSSNEFKKLYDKDKTEAVQKFFTGLNKISESGKSVTGALESIGVSEARMSDALRRMANGHDVLNNSMKTSKTGWEENTALSNEANKAYGSFLSKLEMFKNRATALGITLGSKLAPAVERMTKFIDKLIEGISNLSEEQIETIVNVAIALAGLAVTFKTVSVGISVINGITTAITGMKTALQALSAVNPWLLGLTATLTAIAIVVNKTADDQKKRNEEYNKSLEGLANGTKTIVEELKAVESEYNTIFGKQLENSTRYQELKSKEGELEKEINDIKLKATEENRALTEKEIQLIDKKLEKLRTVRDQERILIEKMTEAQATYYLTELQNFNGSADEFIKLKEKQTKTLVESNEKQKGLLEQQRILEIGILQEKFKGTDLTTNEQYIKEYNALVESYDKKNLAIETKLNEQLTKINTFNTEKTLLNEKEYSLLTSYNKAVEEEEERFGKDKRDIVDKWYWQVASIGQAERLNKELHTEIMTNYNNQLTKNLDENSLKQMASMMVNATKVEMYGGKIEGKHKEHIEKIKKIYEKLPDEQKKVMTDTMQGMYNGMTEKEKGLFNKASQIAGSITSIFKSTFKVQSPSRIFMGIGNDVMKGLEIGLDVQSRGVLASSKKIANSVIESFSFDPFAKMNSLATDVAIKTQSKTILTTPNITFNVPQMTDAELDRAFNYMNKKFGGAY